MQPENGGVGIPTRVLRLIHRAAGDGEEKAVATVELTKENLNEVLSANATVLVDFWASWCGPCRMFGPIFEAASEQHPHIVFGKVDTENQPEIAGSFGIQSIPTLIVLREQVIVFSQPGALPAASLEEVITSVGELDMAEVHRLVAAQGAEQNA